MREVMKLQIARKKETSCPRRRRNSILHVPPLISMEPSPRKSQRAGE
jgi:hypothetical protein